MNWDDLRYVVALSRTGALARASKELGVNHTTVGRRIEAAEATLGVRLFSRTTTGYILTDDGQRLLASLQGVEDAVHVVERQAHEHRDSLEGTVRITAPETFGISYLSPRLAAFGRHHPELTIELLPSGEVLDLGKRQAQIAVRFFRSRHENLVVRRVADVVHALYASKSYLARTPVTHARQLSEHPIVTATPGAMEADWVTRLTGGVQPRFSSNLTLALVGAARASAGITVLPRYLGDLEPTLQRIPMPDEPSEPVWLTVHRDLKSVPRVRVLLDFLAQCLKEDRVLLTGR
jgi:DNA-binding transcriptional LysR family regulator